MASIFQSNLGRLVRAPIFWLAILHFLTGLVYIWATPALEKPDEDGHYGYILYLRNHRSLPPLSFAEGFPSEYKQPPLYYAVASVLTAWLPTVSDPDRLLVTNPYLDFSVPGVRNDNRNVFLHPPHLTPLIFGGRFVSLFFGLGTMLASYFLASRLVPGNAMFAIAAASVVGFHPKFLYMSTAVNNDAAIAFFGALIVTLLAYRLMKGPFSHFAVVLGILLGLAGITKVSGLVFIPLAGLALVFVHWGRARSYCREGVVILTIALLVGGWWYARNALVYDDLLSIDTHISDEATTRPFGERIGHDLQSIERTFWGNPSRAFVSPIWLDRILIWWGRISLVFLIAGVLFNCRLVRIRKPVWLVLLSWPVTLFILVMLYWTQRSWWAYGRLMLPAITPIAILLVLGWLFVSPRRWQTHFLVICAGVVVVASLLTPLVSIYPLYHPWKKWTDGQSEHSADIIYMDPETGDPIAQLIGYSLPEPFALSGAYLPVGVCWRPFAQTTVPYAVFVHLLDMSQINTHGSPGIWGSRRTYPGLGNLSTDRWAPDEPFCDTILVQVASQAPTPLAADIEIGLIDPKTQNRLQITNTQGDALDMSVVRGVPLLSPEMVPGAERSASYLLDNAITLSQMELSDSSENSFALTLTWQSLQPVTYDATTFVHLRDTDGSRLAQVDRQPLEGRFPTSYWLPGQVVTDVLSLSLPPEVYADLAQNQSVGSLVLNVGMYIWPSLDRLPVTDASGAPQPGDMIAIDVAVPPAAKEMPGP